MTYITLNQIVRSILNQKGYSIHWYYQYLKYAADCLRELHYDTLRVVQTKKIAIGDYREVDMPCDYVDWIRLGLPYSQTVRPLVQTGAINRLSNYDADGERTTYASTNSDDTALLALFGNYDVVTNDYGEHIGRRFGFRNSSMSDGFREVREREEFQLSEEVVGTHVILEYISDGTNCNAATKIHPYAQKTIEDYVEWQGDPRERGNPGSPKAMKYYGSHRILRARMARWTVQDIRRAMLGAKNTIK